MEHYLEARISKDRLVHNCNLLRDIARGAKLCVAIKANAYGHGVKECLGAFEQANVDMLAVACIEEAIELRTLKWNKPILILGSEFSIYQGKYQQEIAEVIISQDFRITATRKCDIDVLAYQAERLNSKAKVHLMYDSGMSRMGLREREFFELIEYLLTKETISLEGIYTHFASSDAYDKTFAKQQLEDFSRLVDKIKKEMHIDVPIVHASNSGASIDLPDARFDMIRPGISVYGYHSSVEMRNKPDLKPAMKLVGYLTFIKHIPKGSYIGYGCTYRAERDMTIGIVPIGYADGYFRELSNRGKMLINRKLVPVVGRVSMDQTIVDLTEISANRNNDNVNVGDEVVIISDDRNSENSVEKLAEMLATIPNVIVTAIGKRVKRISI